MPVETGKVRIGNFELTIIGPRWEVRGVNTWNRFIFFTALRNVSDTSSFLRNVSDS
jgi:hypothetical protein